MKLSFDDEGSFQEAVESLRFNSSDPNTRQQMGSNNSMDTGRNEDRDDITPLASDPIPLRRVGSSSGSLSIQETRRSADIPVSFNSLPSNPELIGTAELANGM